jgi:hypothetical protein
MKNVRPTHQEGDGARAHVLRVTHLDQLLALLVRQVAPRQAGVLLVEGAPGHRNGIKIINTSF